MIMCGAIAISNQLLKQKAGLWSSHYYVGSRACDINGRFEMLTIYFSEFSNHFPSFVDICDVKSPRAAKMAPEEVDLTSNTPPKKMKQARLPFAPRPTNKQTTAPATAAGNESDKSNTRSSMETESVLFPILLFRGFFKMIFLEIKKFRFTLFIDLILCILIW